MAGVIRWRFTDPKTGEQWTVPYNPDAMTSPFPTRKFTFRGTTAGPKGGQGIAYEGFADPVSWQFSGQILNREHYEGLLHWSQKENRIWIRDHYGRTYVGWFDNFAPTPKRAIGRYWRHTYTCTFTVQSVTPAPSVGIPA